MNNEQEFDSLKWIRSIRDKNSEKLSQMSFHEYVQELEKRGKESSLCKRFNDRDLIIRK